MFCCGFALTSFGDFGLVSPFKIFSPRQWVAIWYVADADVFPTPVTVNTFVVGNGGSHGEGLVSFARGFGESYWERGDSHLAALPAKSLRWSAFICSLIFDATGRWSAMRWLREAARSSNVYICCKGQMASQASCGQIRRLAPPRRGANQGRPRTSGDEKNSVARGGMDN